MTWMLEAGGGGRRLSSGLHSFQGGKGEGFCVRFSLMGATLWIWGGMLCILLPWYRLRVGKRGRSGLGWGGGGLVFFGVEFWGGNFCLIVKCTVFVFLVSAKKGVFTFLSLGEWKTGVFFCSHVYRFFFFQ